jgi:hypothetical protein
MASFWDKAKEKISEAKPNEEVVDLQAKLSKLDLPDIKYIYDMMTERTYRGREIEQATTTYLKVRYIKAVLEGVSSDEQSKVKSS